MYEAFAAGDREEVINKDSVGNQITESSIIELSEFFQVCAEREPGIAGWR
jgi:hypothetical protein